MTRFDSILCVVEPDDGSAAAIRQAMRLADEHEAKLTVASVLKTSGAWPLDLGDRDATRRTLDESAANKRAAIDAWVKRHNPRRKYAVEIHAGIEFIEIIRGVIDRRHDLLVKCADDVDWLDRLFASDDMHLLRKCPCPVLMLKPGQSGEFTHILATVDVTADPGEPDRHRVQEPLNRKVLAYGAAFSTPGLSTLHVGSVWQAFAEEFLRYGTFAERSPGKTDRYTEQVRAQCAERLARLLDQWREQPGVDPRQRPKTRVHLVEGVPSQEIPRMARQYDANLVVMGTVARTGIPGFIIGNTAEAILEQVQCSVLAIKPDGFESPVLAR